MEHLYKIISILGTVAFSISGAYAGIQKRLDWFGVIVVAFVTAVGGGTLRDVFLGQPVRWIHDEALIFIIFISAIVAILFATWIPKVDIPLQIFDALGLGCFYVLGYQRGISENNEVLSSFLLGTCTACAGGVIRDILLNEIPVLFRKEIYATACLVGFFTFYQIKSISSLEAYSNQITIFIIFAVRILSWKYGLSLPQTNANKSN
ncbi:trimeric intracellular cation channel family protein [Flectobacillus sp. BAB-3569]|uniref:trimeric intracellular cation channel family protein n=1 Tax=Flectobacillus sp. BAB-3569 TaxID=1509483 RepID=UPI000BA3AC11|nr:trimeric intracellular cation channel family protein [Flectobacillus sp. BAB-3569]NBA78387.1 trimeric intracellular cation channel family protein [Emticicia sp. ODNR4P]PAC33276.1 hypothetical protein BWI92_01860 [Flectobacillus sp. BAB-3569]